MKIHIPAFARFAATSSVSSADARPSAGAGVDAELQRAHVWESLTRVERWVEAHGYEAYEPFDGLSSPLRKLMFGNLVLDRCLMQAVRQSPLNIRPLLGIKPLPSTKGRGYMAAGYLTMLAGTTNEAYRAKAVACLEWLIEHKSPKFDEFSWANHFDFASRGGRYAKDESIIVWTALIGHAFVDGFEATGSTRYLEVAESACRWILRLPRERTGSGTCLSYLFPAQSSIHNANMLGAGLLARVWRHVGRAELRDVAREAMRYSCTRQHDDGSWWYAEEPKYHWVDGFHTGYNLDSLDRYIESIDDRDYEPHLRRGLDYYKAHFIRDDGCPRYYWNRTQPVDIQCAAQGIETLSRFATRDPSCWDLAHCMASWTIANMQDPTGYFYYRAYPLMKAKAPMLHWAQATMFRALTLLATLPQPVRS